jgi:ADP-heptose:LPS heptosyltransferase
MIPLSSLRKFDSWVGWPVATLLGLWPRWPRELPGAPREIVIVKLSGLGSLLVCAGVFRALRASQPQARLVVVALEGTAAAARLLPEVDEVLAISASGAGRLLCDGLRVLRELRRRRVDVIADIEYFSKLSTVFCALSGARCRLGFRLPARWRQRLIDGGIAFREDIHFRECVARLLQPLGVDYRRLPDVILSPPPAAEAAAEDLLRRASIRTPADFEQEVTERTEVRRAPFSLFPPVQENIRAQTRIEFDQVSTSATIWAVINPHATALCVQRRWPLERFAQVADALLREHPALRIAIPGTADERNRAERLRELIPAERRGRVCVLAGRTDLATLAALLRQSRLVLTGDTGVMHLAAAVGAPLVALFGPESPVRYGPVGCRDVLLNRRISNIDPQNLEGNASHDRLPDNEFLHDSEFRIRYSAVQQDDPPTRILFGDVPCGPCLSYRNHKRAPCDAEPAACMLAIPVEDVRRACMACKIE